ncbi:Mitochondrial glycine transporter [Vanrija pseudolonga]|uniref:Mitochondrial glycine transporter n=1 Tax=Vanrija pseudolonga TaxID=143232 RepID=A0AAF1BFZ7_9TREE|nr:Mitochondrial glycine transporter [Vanrija pseudolonga]
MGTVRTKADIKAQHHLLSGAISGLTSAVCLQPLDLLKTRLQQGYDVGRKSHRLTPVVRQVLAEDGVRGLWRGTVPTVVRNVPGVAIYFYMLSSIRYELGRVPFFKTVVESTDGKKRSALSKLSATGNLVAGAVARTSVGFVLNPVTIIKARFESNAYKEYRSVTGAFRDIVSKAGFRGLFQGFTATAVRDAPYAGIYVVFYEKCKELAGRALALRPELGIPNAALHSGSAVTASVLATVITSPADCVKTRMQVAPAANPNIGSAVSHIYRDSGLKGFFSGSSLRISRKAASSAIAWTVYEGLLLVFHTRDAARKAAPL